MKSYEKIQQLKFLGKSNNYFIRFLSFIYLVDMFWGLLVPVHLDGPGPR